MILVCGSCTEREKASVDTASGVAGPEGRERERAKAETEGIEYRSRRSLADRPVLAEKSLLAGVGVERRGRLTRNVDSINRGRGPGRKREDMPKPEDKPFAIPKLMVWEAWRQVKDEQGRAGSGRAGSGGVRGRSGGQPLQDLECAQRMLREGDL